MLAHAPILFLILAAPVPKEGPPPVTILQDTKAGSGGTPALFMREQVTLLRSPLVLRGALIRREVARLETVQKQADPEDWLRSNLSIEVREKEGTIRLSLKSGRRQDQAILLNAVAESSLREAVAQSRRQKEQQVEELTKSRTERAAKLERLRLDYKRLAEMTTRQLDPDVRKALDGDMRTQQGQVRLEEKSLSSLDRQIAELREEFRAPPRFTVSQRARAHE